MAYIYTIVCILRKILHHFDKLQLVILMFLTFRLELEMEPIFASLALYDAKEKKKVRI